MSLHRLLYYCAIIGGWSALIGALLSELLIKRPGWLSGGTAEDAASAAFVGAAVGGGLNLVAGMANAQWQQQLKRLAPGLLLGGLSGALGGLIGKFVFNHGLPRGIGWFVMGLSIGAVDGVSERSWKKIRNGLIGGGLGGLLGGFLFDPIKDLGGSRAMASSILAFVLLGLSIGALIGLVQFVLKDAWLSVLDGYRPGRQLILSRQTTTLGRAENATLPFFGPTAREVERQHATIVRQPNGQFALHDLGTKAGTMVNGQRIQGSCFLRDGDQIRLGGSILRFNERARSGQSAAAPAPTVKPLPHVAAVPRTPSSPPPTADVAPRWSTTDPTILVNSSAPPPIAEIAVPIVAKPPPPARKPDVKPNRAPDECPTCGRKVPGPPGKRRCIRDNTVF